MSAGIEPALIVYDAMYTGSAVEKIFFARSKGRVCKMLTVYRDGQRYHLHYLILDRTNPSRAEREAGAKEKRFEVLNQDYYVNEADVIDSAQFPLPALTQQFIAFLKEIHGSGKQT